VNICKDCGKEIDGHEFINETPEGDISYHESCAIKSGMYVPCLGFAVEYDYPLRHATGEAVHTIEEAEEIKEQRIKEGYENVRIEPITEEGE